MTRRAKAGRFAAARSASQLLGGGISRHAFHQPILIVVVRDEVLLATRRYNAMSAHDHQRRALPAAAWCAIAGRLDAAAALVTGDNVNFVRDRANDARRMARAAERCAAEPS